MAKQWQDGAAGSLWHLFLKINSDFGSLNFKLHMLGANLAAVRTVAERIGTRYRWIMPSTAEMVHAHLSKDDTDQDSRQLPLATGPGLYGSNASPDPVVTKFNRYTDCVLVRFEDSTGGGVTRKIGPIPDSLITAQELVTVPASVTGDAKPAAPATAPGIAYAADTSWATEFTNLITDIAANCINVKAGHDPGGVFQYADNWNALVSLQVGGKKGARVMNSPHG
jgi:hypothetical protein